MLRVPLGGLTVTRFTDGEVSIRVEENVRGKDVYIIQSTGPPINDNIVELLLLVSAMRRASAKNITVVIPYFGYSRQDRKRQSRDTIAAADVARMLEAVGVDRAVSIDLHSGQIQGFFSKLTPVDNLSVVHELFAPHFVRRNLHRPVVVSTSGTGLQRVNRFRDELLVQGIEAGLAFVSPTDSRGMIVSGQEHHRVHEKETMTLVGDVRDCDCIIVDDITDTGSRLKLAAWTIKRHGANRIFACTTHGVLSNKDIDSTLEGSPVQELVLTNTLSRPEHAQSPKLLYLNVAPLIADAIYRLHLGLPLSQLTQQF
ncbi:ribose-phosphate diphosphokinase [Plasmodiophora brassicae]|nr:hypothetical protein PBRA_003671 [Plasmodiophora brassicae]